MFHPCIQVKRALTSMLAMLAEVRRQLVAPAGAHLPHIAAQVNMMAAALGTWLERFQAHRDQARFSVAAAGLAGHPMSQLAASPHASQLWADSRCQTCWQP